MKLKLKGVLSYPHLNQPDTKFDDQGVFKASVVCSLSVGKHADFPEKLDELLSKYIEEKSKGKKKKLKQHPDGLPYEVDEDEGTITFTIKNKVYRNKTEGHLFSTPIAFFDKENNPLGIVKVEEDELIASDTVPQIGGGTKAVVSVEVRPWDASGKAGIALRPKALKLIEVQEPSGADAGSYGFDDDDDDDFDAPELNTASNEPSDEFEDDDDF